MISYQLRQRDYLLQISRAMTARLDLPSLLRLILTSAAEIVRAEAGLIALRRGQSQTLAIQASYGIPVALLPRFAPLLNDFPLRAAEYALPDLELRLNLVARAIRLPLQQAVALPLTIEERLLGVIYLFRSGALAFTANDEAILASFADQAAIAVRNAQLYQQVSAEKRQLDAIIEHSADGVMILDPDRHIQVFNAALSRMTGWPAEQALGRPCYQVLALEDASGPDLCSAEADEVAFAGGEPVIVEGVLNRPGGSRLAVSVTYSPLYDEEGRLAQIIANVVDITRFREAEELKSTFVSVVSHELKTPVALIKGYAATLAREDAHWDAATVRESLQVISEESDRLNALINNLLDASRIQGGAFKLERGDVALAKLAEGVVEAFRTQTAQHHFVLDFPPAFPTVPGDEERLRQVLNNLLSNAIKYSPAGGEIRVGGWSDAASATVYVADQGIGIPREEQSKLFQRFYRVDSSLRRTTQGAGLGLYLCKSIVEAHGGRIWLRSEPGKGTTVFFSLPVEDERRTTNALDERSKSAYYQWRRGDRTRNKLGDMNMLIAGRILTGDCRDVLRSFPENSVSACITDPPYNYEFIGHKWDAEEIERRLSRIQDSKTLVKNIPYGSGLAGGVRNARWYERVRQNAMDYEQWCFEWAVEVYRVCKPGTFVAAFNSTRTMAHMQVALERAGFYARDCIVYRRSSGIPRGLNAAAKMQALGMAEWEQWKGWSSCLRNEWEAVVVVQKPLLNNYIETLIEYGIGLFHVNGNNGAFQSNILEDIPRDKHSDYNVHCTIKPLALMEKLVEMLTPPSEEHIVLDPFAGSGTTLVAAKKLGRGFAGIEIVPEYVEIIERRLAEIGDTGDRKVTAQSYTLELWPEDSL